MLRRMALEQSTRQSCSRQLHELFGLHFIVSLVLAGVIVLSALGLILDVFKPSTTKTFLDAFLPQALAVMGLWAVLVLATILVSDCEFCCLQKITGRTGVNEEDLNYVITHVRYFIYVVDLPIVVAMSLVFIVAYSRRPWHTFNQFRL